MHNNLLPFSTTIGTVLNGTSSLASVRVVTNVLAPGSPSVQFLGEIVFVLPIVTPVWGSSGKLCFTKIPLCPPLRGKRLSLEGHPLIGQRLALLHAALLWELEKQPAQTRNSRALAHLKTWSHKHRPRSFKKN